MIMMKFDYVPLCRFLIANTLNDKVNNWGTEIASMSHVTFEHTKGTDNTLADSISCWRSVHLYVPLDPKGEGKEYGHDISEELPP